MTTPRTTMERLAARPARLGMAGAVLVLGLLFWARLIVVSDMPRTAIADEDPSATPPIMAPSSDPEPRESESATDSEQDETPASPRHSGGDEPEDPQSAHPADFPSEAQKSRPHVTEDRD